jgi:hypothetical protein
LFVRGELLDDSELYRACSFVASWTTTYGSNKERKKEKKNLKIMHSKV